MPFARPLRPALLATAATLVALATPAFAETRPSLWDLFTPENLVRRLVQTGIGVLRTKVELQYDHILPDPIAGEVTLTGVKAWPDVPWDGDGCTLTADRVTIATSEPGDWDQVKLRVNLIGGTASPGCLAPDARDMLTNAGLDSIDVAQGTAEIDYTVSSAKATVRVHLDSPQVALIDGAAHFSYLAANATPGDSPDVLAAYLTDASLTIINQGGWDKVKDFLPADMTSPEMAGVAVTAGLTQAIGEANAAADTAQDSTPDQTLTDEQKNFVLQAGRQVARFMTAKDQIVFETTVPGSEVRLTSTFFDDPRTAFHDLRPTVQAHSSAKAPLIEAAMMTKAMAGGADTSDDQRLAVGTALITGTGAPKSVDKGRALLEPLAEAGNTRAALTLAQALAESDPAAAYHHALLAAAAGKAGASAVLDGLEETLDTKAMLEAQGALAGISALNDADFASVTSLRNAALARMDGETETRSYPLAWFWASLAAAAGDPAATDLRDGIDRRMHLHGPAADAAWTAARAPMEVAALHEWVTRDLGTTFGPK
ncbi:MAG: hypothetical protein GC186_03015 [Rhodobacteraceae bacterium]|nr:hypothetical protein [Paracoccaceae bacterium]